MRAIGRILVVVCAITISYSNATDLFRVKRGVVPGNAASRPKEPVKPRPECRSDHHCTIAKTSCGRDPVDNQFRCLCPDQSHPVDDDCVMQPQELGKTCQKDIECIQLAYCGKNESDTTAKVKICQCREEFAEDDGSCSGGVHAIISINLAILVAIIFQNNHNWIP